MARFTTSLRSLVARLGIVLAATVAATGATTVAANAFTSASAYVTTGLNLRAGPGTGYPVITAMSAGDPVQVYGCTSGYGWCDISWGGNRGWASGHYLQMDYQSRREPIYTRGATLGVPFVLFSLDSYWQQNYRTRPFYTSRSRYQGQGFNPQGQTTPHYRPRPSTQPTRPPGYKPRPGRSACPPGTHASGNTCRRN